MGVLAITDPQDRALSVIAAAGFAFVGVIFAIAYVKLRRRTNAEGTE